jgi:hypothetical protein
MGNTIRQYGGHPTAETSYEKDADATIYTGACLLVSLLVITDGTNAATVILYDKASVTGIAATNKLCEFTVPGASQYGGRNWTFPIRCATGIYADVTGTGATYIVEYIPVGA